MPDGINVYYSYDAAGRISALQLSWSDTSAALPLLSNVIYDPFGGVRGWTWANGTLAVREYDQDGRLTTVDSGGLATLVYDDADRITAINTDGSSPGWGYGYDTLDRLTSATRSGLSRTYTYDANGNRQTLGGTQSATFNTSTSSNRLSSVTGSLTRSYTYDAAGNMTHDGTRSYTYDGAGRMKSAGSTAYFYNGLGQRVLKRYWPGNEVFYFYDEAGHVLEKCIILTNDLCNPWGSQQVIWLGDMPVAAILQTAFYNWEGYLDYAHLEVFNLHSDHLNSPRRLTRASSSNQLVWRWDSDPFGIGAANGDAAGDPYLGTYELDLRFPGQVFDVETGLHYNYFRDYDPSIGRYTQSDPIGLAGGLNTYAYADNRPSQLSDPTGEVPGPRPVPAEHLADIEKFNRCYERCALQALGLGAVGAGMAYVGQPVPGSKPFTTPGTSPGTSPVSTWARSTSWGRQRIPWGRVWAPTNVRPFATTTTWGGAVGRWTPFVGWGLLATDLALFGACLDDCMEEDACK